ncbi:hypothetical protein MMC24_001146 [Lignoscripta atroalba]|nr:hypothetical protein [Lignoscripta atroalba]
MLFNLDFPAIVAVAHKHELSDAHGSVEQDRAEPSFMAPLFSRLHALATLTSGYGANDPHPETLIEQESTDSNIREVAETQDLIRNVSLKPTSTTGSVSVSDTGRKAIRKSKTSFQLAHPPPITKHKHRFTVRPRLLLQLRQISEDRRPVPVLDVLPSVVFAPRLARRFPRIFNGRTVLSPDDLVIVTSQVYDSAHGKEDEKDDASEDESWDHREVVAAICQLGRSEDGNHIQTEISLNHGPAWEASVLANGGYEFVSIDDHGKKTIVRWVPKTPGRRPKNSDPYKLQPTSDTDEKKFNFSIINPNTRRHPIVGSMNHNTIDIFNHYQMPPTPASSPNPASPTFTPVSGNFFEHPSLDGEATPAKIFVDTDEHMRILIIITGIWVAFSEGWSDKPSSNHNVCSTGTSVNTSPSTKTSGFSMNLDNRSGSRANTPRGFGSSRSRQPSFNILERSAASTNSIPVVQSYGTTPRRTNSAGAAFLELANNRRASSVRLHGSVSSDKEPGRITQIDPRSRRRRAESFSSVDPKSSSLGRVPSQIAEDGENRRDYATPSSYETSATSTSDTDYFQDAAVTLQRPKDLVPHMEVDGKRPGKLNRIFGFVGKKNNRGN